MCVNKQGSLLILSLKLLKYTMGSSLRKEAAVQGFSCQLHISCSLSITRFLFRWPKCLRFPASFKKSLGNKTPNHTIFAQHLQTPVQSLGSLFTVPMFSLLHTQHHSMPPLVFSSDLLIPILLSSLYASMFACPARLAQLCTKVRSVFQDVGDKRSRHIQCGEDK